MSEQMSDQQQTPGDETDAGTPEHPVGAENSNAPAPDAADLEEPSTEKDPAEQPKAEKPDEPEPSHQAVGIGVIGGPQTLAGEQEQPPADEQGADEQSSE